MDESDISQLEAKMSEGPANGPDLICITSDQWQLIQYLARRRLLKNEAAASLVWN